MLTTASLSQTLQKQSEFNQSVVDAIKSRRNTQQDTKHKPKTKAGVRRMDEKSQTIQPSCQRPGEQLQETIIQGHEAQGYD